MAQQTAMQTFIAWGDEMLLNHPQKILSFGEAIDKAVELLQMEKEQILDAYEQGAIDGRFEMFSDNTVHNAEAYYNKTFTE